MLIFALIAAQRRTKTKPKKSFAQTAVLKLRRATIFALIAAQNLS